MMDLTLFTEVKGSKTNKKLVFIGLSTCGFCKRAKTFLDDEGWNYSFLYIDKLSREERVKIKDDIRKTFTPDLSYPFLIIDDSEYLKGFRRDQWELKLE